LDAAFSRFLIIRPHTAIFGVYDVKNRCAGFDFSALRRADRELLHCLQRMTMLRRQAWLDKLKKARSGTFN